MSGLSVAGGVEGRVTYVHGPIVTPEDEVLFPGVAASLGLRYALFPSLSLFAEFGYHEIFFFGDMEFRIGTTYHFAFSEEAYAELEAGRGGTGEIRPQPLEGASGPGVPWSLGLGGGYSVLYFGEPERYGFSSEPEVLDENSQAFPARLSFGITPVRGTPVELGASIHHRSLPNRVRATGATGDIRLMWPVFGGGCPWAAASGAARCSSTARTRSWAGRGDHSLPPTLARATRCCRRSASRSCSSTTSSTSGMSCRE